MSISVITSRFVRLVYKLNFFSLIIPREHLKSGMMAVANFFTNIEAKSFVSGFSSRSEVMSRFLQNSKTMNRSCFSQITLESAIRTRVAQHNWLV